MIQQRVPEVSQAVLKVTFIQDFRENVIPVLMDAVLAKIIGNVNSVPPQTRLW